MKREKIIIHTKDGYDVTVLILISEHKQSTQGVIQFHSGTVTKKEYYLKLATYLAQKCYIIVLFDYRGVGESKPNNLKDHKISIIDWGTDADAVSEWISKTYPNLKIHLLAHSMGGQLYGLLSNWRIFDKVMFFNSSSGNFNKFVPSAYKWRIKWPSIILFPLLIKIYGFIPGKFGVGEDWPSGVAIDWLSVSKNNNLMPKYLSTKSNKSYYKQIDKKIISWHFSDDQMSPPNTINELGFAYPNATIVSRIFEPSEFGLDHIGHFGLFKRKAEDKIWPKIIDELVKG